jgi:hypothetical protein
MMMSVSTYTSSKAMRGVKKANLPQKVCLVCGRAFTWRKKWAKDWEQVKYCSDTCRQKKGRTTA